MRPNIRQLWLLAACGSRAAAVLAAVQERNAGRAREWDRWWENSRTSWPMKSNFDSTSTYATTQMRPNIRQLWLLAACGSRAAAVLAAVQERDAGVGG